MKRLREKLHSSGGASILLALLFFLVCMMVASTVLMASVSNAGKLSSNYDQQQKYLALSSALRLVAGEIDGATYKGQYTVYTWDKEVPVTDDEGNVIDRIYYYYYWVKQTDGVFECGELTKVVGEEDIYGTVLDFHSELDGWFAEELKGKGYTDTLSGSGTSEYNLTVTVDDPEISEKFPTVNVKVEMNENYEITLTASLGDDANGTIYNLSAKLKPDSKPMIQSGDIPTGRELDVQAESNDAGEICYSTTVKWELDYIGKEAGA